MNSQPELTLTNIRKSPKMGRQARAADFLSEEDLQELKAVNQRGKKSKPLFTETDAQIAEMIARFGYDAYKAWLADEITDRKMAAMLNAERARERAMWIPLESIVANMVSACIKRHKGEKAPKGPKIAQKILKADIKAAEGKG